MRHFHTLSLPVLVVALMGPLTACSKSAAKNEPGAAAAPANAATPATEKPAADEVPAFIPPAVDCATVFPVDEASKLCGQTLTMQILPDEARGKTHPVTCSRVFLAQNGSRLSFRLQTDPRGDAANNIKAFTAEARFPRSWEQVEPVANLGDGARHFLQHGRQLKAPMATKAAAAPQLGAASRHVRAVKGFWKLSVESTGTDGTDATIMCTFDQLEDQARKIIGRLP